MALYPEDVALFPAARQKTAIIGSVRTGEASKGATMADVFRRGLEVILAEVEAEWTPEHETLLASAPPTRPGRFRQAHAQLAESRARGFGPGSRLEDKQAESVRLHDLGVPDSQIAEFFGPGVSRQLVGQWRKAAVKAAAEAGQAARARELYAGGMPVRQVAERLGVNWQKAARWCHNAPAVPSPDRKARARSRSAGSGAVKPVKHATPVTFRAAP